MEIMASACKMNSCASGTVTEGLLLHISLAAGPAAHHKDAFKHMQQMMVAHNERQRLPNFSSMAATVLLVCSCNYDGRVLDKKQYVASSSFSFWNNRGRTFNFGGTPVGSPVRRSQEFRPLLTYCSLCQTKALPTQHANVCGVWNRGRRQTNSAGPKK
jgi:hypothetical protein